MSNESLDIIAREITNLKSKTTLDYSDTKRLEILIKMQRLILNTPTEIIRIEDDIYTDHEVMQVIKKKVKLNKVTNGKTKKATSRKKSGS